jgi:hypothetical protein
MIKQLFLLLALIASASCGGEPHWGEPHHALSQVSIDASRDVQAKVIEATKSFGERYGFKVYANGNLPREGRLVMQIMLTRPDGTLLDASNFLNAGVLETRFYAEKEGADWRTVKEEWLKEMRSLVGKQGNVVDVILEEEPLKK